MSAPPLKKEPAWCCPKCDRTFSSKYKLDSHSHRKNPCNSTVPSMLCCKICGKQFTRSYNLRRHMHSNSCSSFQLPQTPLFYITMLARLAHAYTHPVPETVVLDVWQVACLEMHAAPHDGFDVVWRLLHVLTVPQLCTVLQTKSTNVPLPPTLPSVLQEIKQHVQTLAEQGHQTVGPNAISALLSDVLPR
jgi:hypothetical protein